MKPIIYDLNLKELTDLITESGKSAYLAKQIWQMIYRQLAEDPSEFSNVSEDLRQKLGNRFCFKQEQNFIMVCTQIRISKGIQIVCC